MIDPYEELANAVVLQAVKDYRKTLLTLLANPDDHNAHIRKQHIKRFFRSRWFTVLTDLDSESLIERLDKEVSV